MFGGPGDKGTIQDPDRGAAGGADQGGEARVNEEVVWKARAQEAEEKLAACEQQIEALEGELSSAKEMIAGVERRSEIELALTESGTIDLETARLLTESAIASMDEPDIAVAVRELRARKPYLFDKVAGASSASVMGAMSAPTKDDELGSMADRARGSGDRAELLRYLRARRGA